MPSGTLSACSLCQMLRCVVSPIPEGGARLGTHCTVRQAFEHELVLSATPAVIQTMCWCSCRGVLSVPGCLARLADGALWARSSLQNMCRAAAAASFALPRLQSSSHRSVLSAVPANIRGLSCASEWSCSAAGAGSLVWHDSKEQCPIWQPTQLAMYESA